MKLRVFSRMASLCRDNNFQLSSLTSRLPDYCHEGIDGVSINIPTLENQQKIGFSLANIICECDRFALKLIVELNPETSCEAGRMLDSLSNQLSSSKTNSLHHDILDLFVFRAPNAFGVNEALSYVGEILPLTAQFLEAHPNIGRQYGRRNAHGNILDDHVIGACHRLPFSISELATLLDVFLPARLSLSADNVGQVSSVSESNEIVYDLEAVVQNTDMLSLDNLNQHSVVWEDVWHAQLLDGAKESYVVVNDIAKKLDKNKHNYVLDSLVMMKFRKFLEANQ